MSVPEIIGLAVAAIIAAAFMVALVIFGGSVLAGLAFDAVATRRRRAVERRRYPLASVIVGDDTFAMLCLLCATGKGTCSCAGHCGRQGCRSGLRAVGGRAPAKRERRRG